VQPKRKRRTSNVEPLADLAADIRLDRLAALQALEAGAYLERPVSPALDQRSGPRREENRIGQHCCDAR